MQALTTATATLADTGVLQVTIDCNVTFYVTTTIGTGDIAMKMSLDNSTWVAYSPGVGATAVVITADDAINTYWLPAGAYFKFTNTGNTAATTVYVSGHHINVNV